MFSFLFHTENKLNRSDKHFLTNSSIMKKILNKNLIGIVLIATTFLSCDKIPDGIVESQSVDFGILAITAPTSVKYLPTDSTVIASVKLSNKNSVNVVWCKISSLDGSLIIKSQVVMFDDGNSNLNGDQLEGDGIYSCKYVIGRMNLNGLYQIEFFVEDNIRKSPDNLTKVGTQIFTFNNNQQNLAPVISNLSIPASVQRGESFTFTIRATDPNGQSDIVQVFFKLVRPDNTTVTPGQTDNNGSGAFLMHDDGNGNYGDVQTGDGIYSFKNIFGTTSQIGSWKFEFQAKDRSGILSNVITHSMTVN